ncbi:hypothetical protein ABID82_004259 [Methylobacterium sp. PvP062]|jgi:hypothetical protein|uniref:Uncharacterized protein n=1 Tax=Methylobacterium radiotolerans TaxID=31998 RepID=A0ABV2NL72_9HYPH|nr:MULTISPECIES: hypothetical protein [unclassified Methylobacterium]KZC01423.1 hypothetical protein AU375_02347 [Methylobacterium radiotolerans]MBP2496021.1 hypothetical protein [Methylobacterium sp. PvP105]MBP2504108.1 hypothetical protein [Methylobacterium sp. PvP109]MCX7333102.1 hypothetical protein [Hyphomicrobiales bacterium]
MTAVVDQDLYRAQIALLRSRSPTKKVAPRYSPEDLAEAIRTVGSRLAISTIDRPVQRRRT